MLTIQFMPHASIEGMEPQERIRKILRIARSESIIVMEGRLRREEEAELIKATMENIDDGFKGIELSVTYPDGKRETFGQKLRNGLAGILLGARQGLTVIGPSTLVKEIKKDPDKIRLLTTETKSRRKP